MKNIVLSIIGLFIFTPVAALAGCDQNGYTVIYVNGILGTKEEANENVVRLVNDLGNNLNSEKINVKLGYNPSHLLGAGDTAESFTQLFNVPISDYDLDTILNQIHSELTTRKVLLVGHSQGAFYTNEMYDYLTSHGVPKNSIAVYELATPATFVAGGGQYVNSYNDKVINALRASEIGLNVGLDAILQPGAGIVGSALRANIAIPREPGWEQNPHGGHIFSTYLDGAGPQIVQGMKSELAYLKADAATPSDAADACFTPPGNSVARVLQSAFFALTDPISGAVSTTGQIAAGGVVAFVRGAGDTLASTLRIVAGMFPGTVPNPTGQSAAAVPALDAVQAADETSAPRAPKNSAQQNASDDNAVSQPASATAALQTNTTPPPMRAATPSSTAPIVVPRSGGLSPGFGGGGAVSSAAAPGDSQQSGVSRQDPNSSNGSSGQSQQQSPNSVAFEIVSPVANAALATTSVIFSGTADAGAFIDAAAGTAAASTTADASGSWSLLLEIPEGPATVDFTAASSSGTSATASRDVAVDLTPPEAPVLAAAACADTLASFGCIVASSSVGISWDPAAGASSYRVVKDGASFSDTAGTAIDVSLNAEATTTIAVVAYDAAGNAATSSEFEVASFAKPVIINEIVWAGTDTDPSNSMVELENLAPFPVDLSKLSLTRSGGGSIALSGIIDPSTAASPFFLFGRTLLNTNLSGQLADRQASPAFDQFSPTVAEQLSLVWNGVVLDSTPAASACGGAWCAGSALTALGSNVGGFSDVPTPLSMERKPGTANGADPASWQTSDYYPKWLSDFGGGVAVTWGTPDAKSSWDLPDAGVYCGSHTNLVVANEPFDFGNGDCTYLSRFISVSASREFALFRGDVGSSSARSMHEDHNLIAAPEANSIPADVQPGEHFFFAIFESSRAGDELGFRNYFQENIGTPPHGNYAIFPFTYQPGATH